VDSLELATVISRRAEALGLVQHILVEVNVAGEASKAGVAPGALGELLSRMAGLPFVRCVGLMTLPPLVEDAETNRPHFRALAKLRARHETGTSALPELSMGMSSDFEVALEEGATLVRVGTAIFGARIRVK
jgi:uncharacterized pyridoxal phosphate-containing UPF0001 family protein